MPPSEPSLGSNNPFRRKTPAEPSPAATLDSSPRPPFSTFKSAISRDERNAENDSPVQIKPKKIVKKVRVQSPPPSSPEDAIPVRGYPAGIDGDDDDGYSDDSDSRGRDDNIDPFSNAPADLSDTEPAMTQPTTNMFPNQSLSLGTSDQHTSDANGPSQNAANSKGAMDVNAFKQLLLTGHSDGPRAGSNTLDNNGASTEETKQGSGADKSTEDAHAAKKKSILDAMQETARSSPQPTTPNHSPGRASSTAKKPPPPPSSRHGKLIKIELGADEQPAGALNNAAAIERNPASPEQSSPPSSSDTNKPLPVRPLEDDEAESIFDREAAGKIPEGFANIQANPRPPTPPPGLRQRSESQGSTQSARSKTAPAAPPPRRYGRTDGKAAPGSGPTSDSQNPEEDPPRSSLDSSRSSIRINMSAPAPPPPRRPQHGRAGSSYTGHASVAPSTPGPSTNESKPAGVGFSHMTPTQQSDGMATVTTGKDGQTRISPPPPPPARHSSTRRPPSVHSMELGGGGAPSPSSSMRKVSREKDGATIAPPPPPPSRRRGGSRGNTTESSSSTGAGSNITSTPVLEEPTQGREILADLDALQREVDALRSRYGA